MPNLAWFLFFAQLTLLSILALSILLWVVDLHEQRLRCALFHAHLGAVLVGLGALALGLAQYFYIGGQVILV